MIKLEVVTKERGFVNMKKQNEGITLIALVITIIILLILARSDNSNTDRR